LLSAIVKNMIDSSHWIDFMGGETGVGSQKTIGGEDGFSVVKRPRKESSRRGSETIGGIRWRDTEKILQVCGVTTKMNPLQ